MLGGICSDPKECHQILSIKLILINFIINKKIIKKPIVAVSDRAKHSRVTVEAWKSGSLAELNPIKHKPTADGSWVPQESPSSWVHIGEQMAAPVGHTLISSA